MTLEECGVYCSSQRLPYTEQMPWKGDLVITRDPWTTSDFTCFYDLQLEQYDYTEIPTTIWERIRESDHGQIA